MKRQLLFIQGGGAGTHDKWDNKLVESLQRAIGPDYEIHYPRMPNENDPDYTAWRAMLEKEFAALRAGAILIGHSVGAAILINTLAARSSRLSGSAIVLISAPFVGEGGWSGGDLNTPHDLGARLPKDVPVHLFQGLDDEIVPPTHVELYARAIPAARVHRLPGRDHQLNNDLTEVADAIRPMQAGS